MCQGLGIDAPTWSRVSPLLDHALDLQPRDRAAWLEALPLHDADAFHTLFELNGAKCVALLNDTFKCSEMLRWLSSGRPGGFRWSCAAAAGGVAMAAKRSCRESEPGRRRMAAQVSVSPRRRLCSVRL